VTSKPEREHNKASSPQYARGAKDIQSYQLTQLADVLYTLRYVLYVAQPTWHLVSCSILRCHLLNLQGYCHFIIALTSHLQCNSRLGRIPGTTLFMSDLQRQRSWPAPLPVIIWTGCVPRFTLTCHPHSHASRCAHDVLGPWQLAGHCLTRALERTTRTTALAPEMRAEEIGCELERTGFARLMRIGQLCVLLSFFKVNHRQ
jgi:hypothetical protein